MWASRIGAPRFEPHTPPAASPCSASGFLILRLRWWSAPRRVHGRADGMRRVRPHPHAARPMRLRVWRLSLYTGWLGRRECALGRAHPCGPGSMAAGCRRSRGCQCVGAAGTGVHERAGWVAGLRPGFVFAALPVHIIRFIKIKRFEKQASAARRFRISLPLRESVRTFLHPPI